MIAPTRDLYAHLVLSAQKFKTPLQSLGDPSIEEKIPPVLMPQRIISIKRTLPKEKIEEKISKIIANPKLILLKNQIADIEEQYHNIRESADEDQMQRIENKLIRLKEIIDEKSYF